MIRRAIAGMVGMGSYAFVLIFLLVGGLFAGCANPPDRAGNNPDLPNGFGAMVPNVDFQIYFYANQRAPFVFQPTEESLGVEDVPGLPKEARVDSLAVGAGFGGGEPVFGIRAKFEDERMVPFIIEAFKEDGREADLWFLQQGDILNVVIGQGQNAAAFRRVEEEDFVSLESARPAVWNSILALPQTPPLPPVGIGFGEITDTVIDMLISKAGESLGDGAQALDRLKPLVQRIGISHVAFALYGPQLPPIRGGVDLEGLLAQPFSGLMILDSKIPSFVLSFIFSVVLGGAGLEQVQLDGQTAYAPPLEDGAVLLKNDGSTIVIAVAMEREDARALLATVDAQ